MDEKVVELFLPYGYWGRILAMSWCVYSFFM